MTKNLLNAVILTGGDTGVLPLPGPRVNEVYWAHDCSVRSRWTYSGCPNHTLTGSAREGTLTARASLICEDCGKHGFITANQWSEA